MAVVHLVRCNEAPDEKVQLVRQFEKVVALRNTSGFCGQLGDPSYAERRRDPDRSRSDHAT